MSSALYDIICDAIIPMNIGCAIYDKPVIFGQLFVSSLLVSVNRPIVTIESAPQDRLSVLIQKLLGYYTAIIGFNIHYTYGIIAFTSDATVYPSTTSIGNSLLALIRTFKTSSASALLSSNEISQNAPRTSVLLSAIFQIHPYSHRLYLYK